MSEKNGRLRESLLANVGRLQEVPTTMPGAEGPENIIVRELTGRQSRIFEEMVAKKSDNPLGYLLQLSILDPESKELVFEAADRGVLEELGISSLKPILQLAQGLNGITDKEIEEAKQLLRTAPPSE